MNHRTIKNRTLGLESLENRRVFAGRVTLGGGVGELVNTMPSNISFDSSGLIEVTGTSGEDSVTINKMASGETKINLVSRFSGVQTLNQSFSTRATIRMVFFDAKAGDDQFENNTDLRSNVKGGEGNDRISGGEGLDFLLGGEGNDTISGRGYEDLLFGGLGDDILLGGSGDDWILGEEGNDTIEGNSGYDTLKGGDNSDWIVGGTGNDVLLGGTGNDMLMGSEDFDELYGEEGNDTLVGNAGNDRLDGGDQDDLLLGGYDDDTLIGGNGNDRLFGEKGSDVLFGNNGDDLLDGGQDNTRDYLFGGLGRDAYRGDWVWEFDSFRRRITDTCFDEDNFGAFQYF